MSSESPDGIFVDSLFGAKLQRGLVVLQVGEKGAPVQITATKAREVAGLLLEAAESADTDEVLYRFFRNDLEMAEERFIGLLHRFRMLREEMRNRDEIESED